ncbi:MAG TPA: 2Fe-2S iron-sulfur cluster binding domain-containing protein, partial [Moorella mulderi]|nr:2Fe-2S iron-sulfur cluster binding domain-containing protein [Moorella mulderi]
MGEVTLTIDGRKVTVPSGITVLEAAQRNGIYIPTLCHDKYLNPWGACRICVVEIEGRRGLPAACVTQVEEGMVVWTSSPAVVEARKVLLELIISKHPLDCLVCPRTGNCELQKLAYYYGVKGDEFPRQEYGYPIEEDNSFFIRDMNKCILCAKCVRVCEEITHYNAYTLAHRGAKTKVTPAMDLTLKEAGDCVFCGSCVQVCPVGALVEKTWRESRTPEWEVKKVRTICPH